MLPGPRCLSFPMLGKFLAAMSSNTFSAPFSPSSSGTPIMQMFICLMLSHRSINSPHFLKFFFFSVQFELFVPLCIPVLCIPQYNLVYY